MGNRTEERARALPVRRRARSHRVWGAVFAALAAASLQPAAAQEMRWRLPPAGAAEYRRACGADASEPARSRGAAADAPLDAAVPARCLPQLPPAPFLCEGELEPRGRGPVGRVADLRDVLRALAFDLGSRSAAARFPRLLPFGDVAVRGAWGRPDDDGCQVLEGSLTARPPARDGGEPRDVAARLAALSFRGAAGSVHVARTFDAARGVVTGYRGELDLVVEEGARSYRRLRVTDEWQLVAVRENQDFDFRRRVAEAIRTGAAWVREQVAADRSYLVDRRGERNYGSGRLALALLAMLHGHVPADDPVVRAGFAALRRRRQDDAYSLAAALMAVGARQRRGALDDADRKAAARWLERLLSCTDPRVDAGELLRFNYTRGPRYDTSLQQYGLLGMRAAQRLGLEVPDGAFAAAARHLLDVQAPPSRGASSSLRLVDDAGVRAAAGTDAPPEADVVRARARGFSYQEPDAPAFGSMTAAGTSGLLLARDGMRAAAAAGRRLDRALTRRVDAAIHDGFAWLAANFSVRCNPGDAERSDNHWSYWLYCLERCCELDRVARLQDRDWYYEGGLQLLAAQKRDGSFRSGHASTLQLDSTCFAILFLAKASAPGPLTGR